MKHLTYTLPTTLSHRDVEEIGFAYAPYLQEDTHITIEQEQNTVKATSGDTTETKLRTQSLRLDSKQVLYALLRRLTGKELPYGIMTGVKPVLKVLNLQKDGKSPEEIDEILKHTYFVSEQKRKLLLNCAANTPPAANPGQIDLYIQIPYCPDRCSYCSFRAEVLKEQNCGVPEEYFNALLEEMRLSKAFLLRNGLTVPAVYIGGGTPATLSKEQTEKLLNTLWELPLEEHAEITFEGGRGELLSEEKLQALAKGRVKRLCINCQSMHEETLKKIGRRSAPKDFLQSIKRARQLGFESLNCDLIAGIDATQELFLSSLKEVIALGFENITIHSLAIKNRAKLEKSALAPNTYVPAALQKAHIILEEEGHLPYYLYRQKFSLGEGENTGFAKKGKECLYNSHMINNHSAILGLGTGASGVLFRNGQRHKFFNLLLTDQYIATVIPRTMQKLEQMQQVLDDQTQYQKK